MRSIALLGSIIFAFIALYVENRRDKTCSKKIIIPTVWYILAVIKPIDYWLNPGLIQQASQNFQEGSSTMRLVLSVLMICGILVLLTRRIDWMVLIKQNRFFVILLLFMLASLIWSNYKFVALKRYLRFLGDLIMVLIVLTEKRPIAAITEIILNSAYILIPISIVFAKYYPHLGRAYNYSGTRLMWTGVTSHKNTLAIYCTISLLTIFAVILERRNMKICKNKNIFRFILFLMICLILVGGGEAYPSATAIATVPVGIIFFFLVRKIGISSVGKKKTSAILLFTIVVVVIGFQFILNTVVVGLLGRDLTFTGRDIIWRGLIAIGRERPMLGSGFGSFWMRPIFGVNQAHNGFINIFLQLGLVGLAITVFFIIDSYNNLWYGNDNETAYRLALFLVVLVQNISEATLLQSNSSVWIVFLFISLNVQDTSKFYLKKIEDTSFIDYSKNKKYKLNY